MTISQNWGFDWHVVCSIVFAIIEIVKGRGTRVTDVLPGFPIFVFAYGIKSGNNLH